MRKIIKAVTVGGLLISFIGTAAAVDPVPASADCTKGDLVGDRVLMDNVFIDGVIPEGVIDTIPPGGVLVEIEVLRANCRSGNSHKAIVIPQGAETRVDPVVPLNDITCTVGGRGFKVENKTVGARKSAGIVAGQALEGASCIARKGNGSNRQLQAFELK